MARNDGQLSLTLIETTDRARSTTTPTSPKQRVLAQASASPDEPPAQPLRPTTPMARGRRVTEAGEVVFLSMPQVIDRYADVWSKWTIYEWVRTCCIPHVKLPGRRELLFRLDDLEAYESGEVELETVKLPQGGRLCRPRRR